MERNNMFDSGLRGKVVCVTGGNNPQGIGAASARAFAAQSASLFVHYFRQTTAEPAPEMPLTPGEDMYWNLQALDPATPLKQLRGDGVRAESWEADLGTTEAVDELLDRAERAVGSVDVLVNNAAWSAPDTFKTLESEARAANTFSMERITAKSHDRHFAVNSRAPALLMAEFARRHVARGKTWGRIVNISTDAASGYPDEVSYWASKHALESYSRAAAMELGRYGITVNVASLGPIQTGWISSELEARLAAATPLGRIGQPSDVADVIVFLASEQARWLTGQLIYVGGGHRMTL